MIEPLPCSSMPGRTALHRRYIALAFRSKAKSQSSSVLSRILPVWTNPAQLNRTSSLSDSANTRLMSSGLVASSFNAVMPSSPSSSAKAVSLMSVAMTEAPALAKASALARPMPCPAAVIKAVLPSRLNSCVIILVPFSRRHFERNDSSRTKASSSTSAGCA